MHRSDVIEVDNCLRHTKMQFSPQFRRAKIATPSWIDVKKMAGVRARFVMHAHPATAMKTRQCLIRFLTHSIRVLRTGSSTEYARLWDLEK